MTYGILSMCGVFIISVAFLGQCSSTGWDNVPRVNRNAPEVEGEGRDGIAKPRFNPKLSHRLNKVFEAYQVGGIAEAKIVVISHNMVLKDNRIQVTIVTSEGSIAGVRKAVEAIGGKYQLHYRNLLQTMLPISALETLAERPDVKIIREPQLAVGQ